MKCVGAGISGGGHQGPTRHRGQVLAPPDVVSVPNILKYSIKIIFHFWDIWRTFILGVFFIARIIQKTDRKYYSALFNLNNRK